MVGKSAEKVPAMFPAAIVARIRAAKMGCRAMSAWAEAENTVPVDIDVRAKNAFANGKKYCNDLYLALEEADVSRQRIARTAGALGAVPPRAFADGDTQMAVLLPSMLFLKLLDPDVELPSLLAELDERKNNRQFMPYVVEILDVRINADREATRNGGAGVTFAAKRDPGDSVVWLRLVGRELFGRKWKTAMARTLGVSRPTVNAWDWGTSEPARDLERQLLEVLRAEADAAATWRGRLIDALQKRVEHG